MSQTACSFVLVRSFFSTKKVSVVHKHITSLLYCLARCWVDLMYSWDTMQRQVKVGSRLKFSFGIKYYHEPCFFLKSELCTFQGWQKLLVLKRLLAYIHVLSCRLFAVSAGCPRPSTELVFYHSTGAGGGTPPQCCITAPVQPTPPPSQHKVSASS